jgi:hypothetical protein
MSRKPFTKADADDRLRQEDWRDDLMKRLPDDVDVNLAASAALRVLENRAWGFGRSCQRLPTTVIREVLARLENEKKPEAVRIFLREVMRLSEGRALEDAWTAALLAVLDLDTEYGWGSKQKKAKFRGLAQNPVTLAAIQAAVVGAANPPLDMLAVLANDGGEASADALLAVFALGRHDPWLEYLKTHAAKSAAIEALLSGVSARLEKKEAASPALVFARDVLGLEVAKLSVRATLNSVETNSNRVPLYQGSLAIDSSSEAWWSVHLSRVDAASLDFVSTGFGMGAGAMRDDLKLGRCAVEELPRWVAATAKKLNVRWHVSTPYGSLRGKKREAFTAWLFGGD